MATSYPGAIDGAPSTHADVSDATLAIETELGAAPSGVHTTVAERMASLGRNTRYYMASGRYYGAIPFGTTVAASGMAANRLYAMPLYVPDTVTLDRIGVDISTAAAGKLIRLGLYQTNAAGWPGTLLLDAGTVDASTAAGVEIIINQQVEGPRTYWLVALSDGTPQLRAFPAAAHTGWTSVTDNATMFGFHAAQTYGPLPATCPALVLNNDRTGMVKVRVA